MYMEINGCLSKTEETPQKCSKHPFYFEKNGRDSLKMFKYEVSEPRRIGGSLKNDRSHDEQKKNGDLMVTVSGADNRI